MSNRQHILYNHEVIPPSGVWDRIAEELDASHLSDSFPSIIYEATATPPPGAWNRIAAALDETLSPTLAASLYKAEIAPPATAWDRIAASLDEVPKVIPLRKRTPAILRYLAAAVLIGFAALGAFTWFNDDDKSRVATADRQPARPGRTDSLASIAPDPGSSPASAAAPEEARSLLAASSSPANDETPRVRDRYETTGSKALFAYQETVRHPADRYIMLLTPDGNIIRMSKKWGDMLCCVSGEEQDKDCKDQLQRWQEKMADSPVAPSPGNFMDILTLVNTLNETDL